ncbi:MAG: hypothetical protein ACRC33_12630, partial [Gemmataceae bacterium]
HGRTGRDLVLGPLVTPLTVRIEIDAEHGPTFTDVLNPDRPAARTVRVAEPDAGPVTLDPAPAEEIRSYLGEVPAALAALAKPDGDFQAAVEGDEGRERCGCDLDPVVYAAVLHRVLGLPLPRPASTRQWLTARQGRDGAFMPKTSGVWPADSAAARLYATSQALCGLFALGRPPRWDPLPAIEEAARAVAGEPEWATVLGPLAARAYRQCGRPMPPDLEAACRERLARPPADEYLTLTSLLDAAWFDRLVGRPPADVLQEVMLEADRGGNMWNRPMFKDQPVERCWFAGVYLLRLLGAGDEDAALVLAESRSKCWQYARTHWEPDGFKGEATAGRMLAVVGALTLTGDLDPPEPWTPAAELLGWGHLLPPAGAADARRAA